MIGKSRTRNKMCKLFFFKNVNCEGKQKNGEKHYSSNGLTNSMFKMGVITAF